MMGRWSDKFRIGRNQNTVPVYHRRALSQVFIGDMNLGMCLLLYEYKPVPHLAANRANAVDHLTTLFEVQKCEVFILDYIKLISQNISEERQNLPIKEDATRGIFSTQREVMNAHILVGKSDLTVDGWVLLKTNLREIPFENLNRT